MTIEENSEIWNSLHEAYSICKISSKAMSYEVDDHDSGFSAYATLLERASEILLNAIAIVDAQDLALPSTDN